MCQRAVWLGLFMLIGTWNLPLYAQEGVEERPFIKGGVYDKPYLFKSSSRRASIGGYTEAHFRYEREEGITEELTFVPKRFNIFTFASISERFSTSAELEFEEGTEEILLEFGILDFEVHEMFTFRGGMLLTPLGKFNLAHDSPANKMTDRPLVSTQIISTTLSEPGMGFYGALYPSARSRLTYELYAVNGFNADIIEESPEGTRIAQGKRNVEDNNNSPAFTGRVAVSPLPEGEVGISWHTGKYNKTSEEGLKIDEGRNLTILAIDGEFRRGDRYEVLGEYARSWIDLPTSLMGTIFSERQQGLYIQGSADFLRGAFQSLPRSFFAGVARYGLVDFDTKLKGDTHKRLTLGLNFRPTEDSVFKLDYQYNWVRDRLDVRVTSAAVLFSTATYF